MNQWPDFMSVLSKLSSVPGLYYGFMIFYLDPKVLIRVFVSVDGNQILLLSVGYV